MGLFDMFLGPAVIAKADAAVAAEEEKRRERVRAVLALVVERTKKACLEKSFTKSFEEALAPVVDQSLNEVLKATSQAPSIRAIAGVVPAAVGEAINKIADKLA